MKSIEANLTYNFHNARDVGHLDFSSRIGKMDQMGRKPWRHKMLSLPQIWGGVGGRAGWYGLKIKSQIIHTKHYDFN